MSLRQKKIADADSADLRPRKRRRIGRFFRSRWGVAIILLAVLSASGYATALYFSSCSPKICLSGIADAGNPRRFTKEAEPPPNSEFNTEMQKCQSSYEAVMRSAPVGEPGRRIRGNARVTRNLCFLRVQKKYGKGKK